MFLFSFGHKPLFIPWTAIHNRRIVKFLWRESIEFDVGHPYITTIQLPKKILEPVPTD